MDRAEHEKLLLHQHVASICLHLMKREWVRAVEATKTATSVLREFHADEQPDVSISDILAHDDGCEAHGTSCLEDAGYIMLGDLRKIRRETVEAIPFLSRSNVSKLASALTLRGWSFLEEEEPDFP